jgi:ribonucleoside-diphosphate reductase alpha chain
MELNENALRVLKARYLIKDEKGNVIETPEHFLQELRRQSLRWKAIMGESAEWEEKFPF